MDYLQAMNVLLDEYLQKASLLRPSDIKSPFSSFDVPLGDRDVPLVDAFIFQQNAQLSTIALQIASIDDAAQKLVVIRTKLEQNNAVIQQSLVAHQALTSPARRIPPEVLCEVFYHCLPTTPYITPKDVDAPMVLTQVCHHWRAVAMSTPRLWHSLSIHLQQAASDTYRRGCVAWLAKARSVPLTVRVLNDVNMFADPTVISSILQWLRPIIIHCNDIWWHGPSLSTMLTLDTPARIDLPLERLRITSHQDSPSIQLPGSVACLRFASLQCLNHDLQSLDGINLPWHNLVELRMHFALFNSTLFVQLLAHCGHLHSLVVSCLCADENQLSTLRALLPGSIVHPNLRRIEIKVIRAGLDLIFGALTLPALQELDVCFCYRERDTWPHAAFMEMVKRSRCTLKRLIVRSNKSAALHFGEYMESMPGLAVC